MELLEYQVKEWFGKIGIPVLPSQRINHPTDLKRLKISYPVVLKSQVYGGGRAQAGGVKFVETTIDAIATAHNIFNLPISGELPEVLLAEAKYEADQEFYLGVVLDSAVCRPVLLGCTEADVEWESAGDKMQHVVVEQEFSPFYARRLALKMGLHGVLMQSVSAVVEKMYRLFVEQDLDLIEINPLGIKLSGEVMALNGSVNVNERAIRRHPDIAEIAKKNINRYTSSETIRNLGDWDGIELNGKIGILGNGAGSVMATLDLVANAGGKPGVCINLRHASPIETSITTFSSRLEEALKNLAADKSIQVILINFLSSIAQTEDAIEVIENFIQQHKNEIKPQFSRSNGNKNRREGQSPYLVVRLAGSEFNEARKHLTKLQSQSDTLIVLENLDEAVAKAVSLAKPTTYKKLSLNS
jgi:succinyl-CoA synthetase beta subunit